MAINLDSISWKRSAKQFVSENTAYLRHPERMSRFRLCEAITYCNTIDNPFSEELCRRVSDVNCRKFRSACDCEDWRTADQILTGCAQTFGYILR